MDLTGIFVTIAIAFLITVLLSPIFIPLLRRLKFGQSIREEGPKSHMVKTGTPTMGGVMIVLGIVITSIIMVYKVLGNHVGYEFWLLIFVLLGYGVLGFLDDFIKVAMKRNLGLTSKQKMLGQIVIALIFFFILKGQGFSTDIQIPGTDIQWDFGWFMQFLLLLF